THSAASPTAPTAPDARMPAPIHPRAATRSGASRNGCFGKLRAPRKGSCAKQVALALTAAAAPASRLGRRQWRDGGRLGGPAHAPVRELDVETHAALHRRGGA